MIFAASPDADHCAIADVSAGAHRRPLSVVPRRHRDRALFGVGATGRQMHEYRRRRRPQGLADLLTAARDCCWPHFDHDVERQRRRHDFPDHARRVESVVDHFFTGAKTDGDNPRHNAMTLVGTVSCTARLSPAVSTTTAQSSASMTTGLATRLRPCSTFPRAPRTTMAISRTVASSPPATCSTE